MGRGVSRFAHGHSCRRKGFISFLLAAVFLFALIPAAALVSSRQPDISFENFRAALVEEAAIKQAFYRSSQAAAQAACAGADSEELAAIAGGPPPRESKYQKIQDALRANAVIFESELRAQGYDAQFWCGKPSASSRLDASRRMMESRRPATPAGASAANDMGSLDPLCNFQVDMVGKTISFGSFGFSFYDAGLGLGKAAELPYSKGVDFACD